MYKINTGGFAKENNLIPRLEPWLFTTLNRGSTFTWLKSF